MKMTSSTTFHVAVTNHGGIHIRVVVVSRNSTSLAYLLVPNCPTVNQLSSLLRSLVPSLLRSFALSLVIHRRPNSVCDSEDHNGGVPVTAVGRLLHYPVVGRVRSILRRKQQQQQKVRSHLCRIAGAKGQRPEESLDATARPDGR